MAALLSLIGGVKGIVIIALLLGLGSYVALQKYNLGKAETARDAAIVQRDQAGVERDKAIAAAKVNEATISRLQQEKDLVNQALNSLQAARDTNRTNTVTREVIIQNQAAVPGNAAIAAPVLGSIIEELQADRNRRRGIVVPVATQSAATIRKEIRE